MNRRCTINPLLSLLVVFVVIVAIVAVPVAIRDRRRAPAEYAGRQNRQPHPFLYDRSDGVSAYGADGIGGGFDGGGCGGGDGGGGC